MATDVGPVQEIIDRLVSAGLIPPVKGVEQRGGGWVHVTVAEPISEELRTRVTEALGPGHWTLRQAEVDPTDYLPAGAT